MKLLLLLASFGFLIQVQSQTIITAAGTGSAVSGGDGGPFANATFDHAGHMIYDKAGNLYIIEVFAGCIRRVDATSGIITTLVKGIYNPRGIAFDPQEQYLYIAANACVYKLNMSNKVLAVFAGIPGSSCTYSICGDNIPALTAQFGSSTGVTVDSIGNVYVADFVGSRIRRIDITTGIITTYSGGAGCNCVGYGDEGPANQSTLVFPSDVCFDNQGNLIIADAGLQNIRKVDSKTGIISTIAGPNTPSGYGYGGDGGPAVNARFASPAGIFIDKYDNLYIGDEGNHRIRKVDKAGIVTTIAGNGVAGYSGDCGPADKARLNNPMHAVVSRNGSVLIADFNNNVIREVINAVPNVISAAANTLCVNSTLKLIDSAQGGVWQSSNTAIAKVGSDGVVTALAGGKVNISYYITNGCNNNSSTVTLTVYSTPTIGPIQGAANVCEAGTINLTNPVAGGGVWSSSDSSVAYPGNGGSVKGVAAGTATIKYTVVNAGCSNAESVTIAVNPLLKPQPIVGDTSICVNGNTTLTNANTGGTWSINNGIAAINPSTGLVNGIRAGNAIVTYTVTNGCGSAMKQSGIKINSLPYFSLGTDTSICLNSKLLVQPPVNHVSYLWEDGSNASNHLVSLPASYWVKITDTNQCSFSDTINIQNKPLPPVYIGHDTTLCNDLTLTLHPGDVSITSYQWQDGSTQPSYTVKKAGLYSVAVTGSNGCMKSDTINVKYLYSPNVNLGNSGSVCPGNPIVIDPHLTNVSYLWQDGSTTSTYTVTEPGIYSLTATNFCDASTASVEFKKGLCQLLMPDAFTPNNDGLNDVFRVKYGGFIKSFHFTIFNRWGEKVFETTDPAQGWNGKYKSLDQDMGNYTWTITLTDFEGRTENARGSVVLIR